MCLDNRSVFFVYELSKSSPYVFEQPPRFDNLSK